MPGYTRPTQEDTTKNTRTAAETISKDRMTDLRSGDKKFGAGAGETQGGQPPPEYTQALERVIGTANVAKLAEQGHWATMGQVGADIMAGRFDNLPPEFANMRGGSPEENQRNAELLFSMLNQLGNGKAVERATETATPILESMVEGEQAVLHVCFDTKHTDIATSIDDQYDEEGRRIIQVMNPSDEVIQELVASGRFPSVILTGHGDQGKIYTNGESGVSTPRDANWMTKNFGDPTKVKSIFLDFCESDASTKVFRDLGIATMGYRNDVDLDTGELARHLFAYGSLMEEDMAMDQSTLDGLAAGFDGVGGYGDNLRGSSKDGSAESDAGFDRGISTVQTFLDKLMQGPGTGAELGEAMANPEYVAEPQVASGPVGPIGMGPADREDLLASQYFGDTGIAPVMSSDEAMRQSMTYAGRAPMRTSTALQSQTTPWRARRDKRFL